MIETSTADLLTYADLSLTYARPVTQFSIGIGSAARMTDLCPGGGVGEPVSQSLRLTHVPPKQRGSLILRRFFRSRNKRLIGQTIGQGF